MDSSIAAKWVLPKPGHIQAFRLLTEEQSGEILLIAPDLLLIELASLLVKKVRRKQISANEALAAFQFLTDSVRRLFQTGPLLGRALDLAIRHQMSLWDCVYLALAIEHDCPLITADQRLFNSGRGRHPSIRLLA